ncbi:hypothetical protein DPEC_G00050060 [Dallia pectoralis]|uniref:Uncharacterized protein n=1 Tax=Dallia pectoralis TaxID=75939 RepID=A0ACC2HB49_DALPE|nr:hypothetical protein DPEC_G00050060 [Dallia pectoralis]
MCFDLFILARGQPTIPLTNWRLISHRDFMLDYISATQIPIIRGTTNSKNRVWYWRWGSDCCNLAVL